MSKDPVSQRILRLKKLPCASFDAVYIVSPITCRKSKGQAENEGLLHKKYRFLLINIDPRKRVPCRLKNLNLTRENPFWFQYLRSKKLAFQQAVEES